MGEGSHPILRERPEEQYEWVNQDLEAISKLSEVLRVVKRERELANICPEVKAYCNTQPCSSFELYNMVTTIHNLECTGKYEENTSKTVEESIKSVQDLREFYHKFFTLRYFERPITSHCARLREWVPASGFARFNPRTEVC